MIKRQTERLVGGPRPQQLKEEPAMHADTRALIAKIRALPAERIAEVEDFVDFIATRRGGWRRSAGSSR